MDSIAILSRLIKDSSAIAIITGAGISTSAGIPDFRGPNGLYKRKDISADNLFDIKYFNADPTLFYSVIPEFIQQCSDAEPTIAHKFIAHLEKKGKLSLLLTQNIDGLHEKAGNRSVINIHGSFGTFTCTRCTAAYNIDDDIQSRLLSARIPLCRQCGGVLKPDIVFFGEPVVGFNEAAEQIQKCDLLISIGTSLVVNPAAALPQYLNHGAHFVIINKGSTPYDSIADLHIEEDIDYTARKLLSELGWDVAQNS